MKKLLVCILGALLVLGGVVSVQAAPFTVWTTPDYPTIGTLGDSTQVGIGTGGVGAYDEGDLNPIITAWNAFGDADHQPSGLPLIDDDGMVEASLNLEQPATINFGGGYEWMSVKYDGWVDLIHVADADSVVFVGKAGTYGASHYRLWNPVNIPDPATAFLLGSACLIGFGASRRKQKG